MGTQSAPKAKGTPAASAVFMCLYEAGEPLTKQEAAVACELSLPTVYQAFSSLEEQGLIEGADNRDSTGGRRAQTFCVSLRSVATIGISLTGRSARCVACDLYGNRIDGLYLKQPLGSSRTAKSLAGSVARITADMQERLAEQGIRCVGVGIAVPSSVDPASGRLLNTSVLRVDSGEVYARDLVGSLRGDAQVFNDANCGAYCQIFPKTQGESLAYLSLERGVGGAVIVDGRPFAGPRGTCGEFGHICIEPGGKQCACGRVGCLEAYCSSNALSEELGVSLDQFFSLVATGDAEACGRLADYLAHLARGLQAIHTALGVDVLVGGELSSYLEPVFDQVVAAVEKLNPAGAGSADWVALAKDPLYGVPVGAAQLMARRFIEGV